MSIVVTEIVVLGNAVRVGKQPAPILVRDANDALVNPATIAITWTRPDGTPSVATPAHYLDGSSQPIVGTFYTDYEPAATAAMVGPHTFALVTTGPDAKLTGTVYFIL